MPTPLSQPLCLWRCTPSSWPAPSPVPPCSRSHRALCLTSRSPPCGLWLALPRARAASSTSLAQLLASFLLAESRPSACRRSSTICRPSGRSWCSPCSCYALCPCSPSSSSTLPRHCWGWTRWCLCSPRTLASSRARGCTPSVASVLPPPCRTTTSNTRACRPSCARPSSGAAWCGHAACWSCGPYSWWCPPAMCGHASGGGRPLFLPRMREERYRSTQASCLLARPTRRSTSE
mmetsp:Transcript_41897/g.105694  ORF Transcript_41897/g.105694 Transcript_41897/m.105694 type:complete len:234 (+) Transcript_41897:87-788(+)